MFNSEVLEVGIGMALLFFFMSLIASAFCEALESWLKVRAKYLEKGVTELLGKDNEELLRNFYEHPIISALYDGKYRKGARSLPSYIPRESFALAVLDLLRSRTADGASPLSFDSLRTSLAGAATPNSLQKAVLTVMDAADGDLKKVQLTLENWFDGVMDRVAGWFKRRNGFVLMLVGLFAAVTLNVDAITVARQLVSDKALRAAVVEQADNTVAGGQGMPAQNGLTQDKPEDKAAELKRQFVAIGYPTGWIWLDGRPYPGPQYCSVTGDKGAKPECTPWGWNILYVIAGWVITTLAIMLGAPFWFDVLNKFMIVRSTVKPKEKSQDERA